MRSQHVAAVISLGCFILSAGIGLAASYGTRFGWWDYETGLKILSPGIVIAIAGSVSGAVWIARALNINDSAGWRFGVLGLAGSLVVAFIPLNQLRLYLSSPPIHDITTDVADPPSYDVVVKLRGEGPDINPLTYDAEKLPPLQKAAYPKVVPLDVSAAPAAAFDAVAAALPGLGLEVVNADPNALRVEAVATTFWFGFKDDVVVRIRPTATGSRIDVRSVSRVGVGDSGANAKRIVRILDAIKARMA